MPPAIAWKPVTWPSTRQGVISTLLTILPGHEAGGVSAVCPRTRTRSGAESAAPGAAIATRAVNRQATAISAQARPDRLFVCAEVIETRQHGVRTPVAPDSAFRGGGMRPG